MEQLEKAAKRRKLVKCPFAGCSAQLRKDDVVVRPYYFFLLGSGEPMLTG